MNQQRQPAPPTWQPMQVRPMQATDVPLVASMLHRDAEAGHYANRGHDLEQFVATVVGSGVMPGPRGSEYRVTATVGIEWDELVAYAFVRTPVRDASLAEIWMFGVDPDVRFQRLGKRLLDQVMTGPSCAGRAVMARCHPASSAMRTMLRHRRFDLIATGLGGVSLLANGFSEALRDSLALIGA